METSNRLRNLQDRDVLDAFVHYLEQNGHPGLKLDRRPDEENRDSSDIDAIAGKFAIEHTSVDTVENQTRDSAYFLQVANGLEQEFSGRLAYRLTIIFPYDGVRVV